LTLDRLCLGEDARKNVVGIPYCTGVLALDRIQKAIEARAVMPAVVFIEGMDIMVAEQNKMTSVAEFLGALNEIAMYYHIAVIGSVGSPKLKKDEDFKSDRDSLYGSAVWGRMTSTIVRMTVVNDDTGAKRRIIVMPRNSATERYIMSFSTAGQLEVDSDPGEVEPSEVVWFRERRKLAAADASKLYWLVTELAAGIHVSDSTALRRIKEGMAKGWVQEKPGKQNGHAALYKVAEVFK
jgi:hypothetical protein